MPHQRSDLERFTDNVSESWRHSLAGSLADRAAIGIGDVLAADDPQHAEQHDVRPMLRDREALYQMQSHADPFYRAGNGNPWDVVKAGAATMGGAVVGSMDSPEAWVAPAAKAPLAAKMAINAAVMAATDPAVQALHIGGGLQDQYDPWETVASAGVGAAIPGGLHVAGIGGRAAASGAGAAIRAAEPAVRSAGRAISGAIDNVGEGLRDHLSPTTARPTPDVDAGPAAGPADTGWEPVASAPTPAPTPALAARPAAARGPLASTIASVAQAGGVDPDYALNVARIESHLDPNAVNHDTDAAGLFQFKGDTWDRLGGGNPFDPATAAQRFSTLTRQNQTILANRLGRQPEPWELYLAHQQGPNEAAALINHPDAPAVDMLRLAGQSHPDAALLGNGGARGMSAGTFAELWHSRYDQASGSPSAAIPAPPPIDEDALARQFGFESNPFNGPEADATQTSGPVTIRNAPPDGGVGLFDQGVGNSRPDQLRPGASEATAQPDNLLPGEPASPPAETPALPRPSLETEGSAWEPVQVEQANAPPASALELQPTNLTDATAHLGLDAGAGGWEPVAAGKAFDAAAQERAAAAARLTALAHGGDILSAPPAEFAQRLNDLVLPGQNAARNPSGALGRPPEAFPADFATAREAPARQTDLTAQALGVLQGAPHQPPQSALLAQHTAAVADTLSHLGVDPTAHPAADLQRAIGEFRRTPTQDAAGAGGWEPVASQPAQPGAPMHPLPTAEPQALAIAAPEILTPARPPVSVPEGPAAEPVATMLRQRQAAAAGQTPPAPEAFGGPQFDAKSQTLRDRLAATQPAPPESAQPVPPPQTAQAAPGPLASPVAPPEPQIAGQLPASAKLAMPLPPRPMPIRAVMNRLLQQGVPVKVEGQGPTGPRLTGLEGRWPEAVDALSSLQSGDARGVLQHPAVGPIDVMWGNADGGLQHIMAQHPEVIPDLPQRIAQMSVLRATPNRVHLQSADARAVVRLNYDGNAKTWLLTAFELAHPGMEADRLAAEGQGGGGRTESAAPDSQARSPDQLAPQHIGPSAPPEKLASGGQRTGMAGQPFLRAVPAASAADTGVRGYRGPNIADLAQRLREALGVTQRQGRMTLKRAVGEYDTQSGVIRTRPAPQELNVLGHETTHHLEGQNLPNLSAALSTHAAELSRLAYQGADPAHLRQEGFAEFGRWYLTNPAHAQKVAPNFYPAFETAMAKDAPEALGHMQAIQGAYQRLLRAPSSGVLSSMVVKSQRPTWLGKRFAMYASDGIRGATRYLADEAWTSLVDRFHPINVALRDLARIALANGKSIGDLKTVENPYRLARLAAGSYSQGHMDIVAGVHPFRGVDPEGPGIRDILGKADAWGGDASKDFDAYLIARRMEGEWRRYDAGQLARPPDATSGAFHTQAIKDFEAAHPAWREAGEMANEWNARLWRKERDAGLISDETYLGGLKTHPFYVPAMRDLSDKEMIGGGKPTTGAGKFAGGSRAFRGSDRMWVSPIQSMMKRAYELNAVIAQNEAKGALYEIARNAGQGGGAIVERIPAHESEALHIDALDALESAAKEAGLSPRDVTTLVTHAEAELAGQRQATVYRQVPTTERGEPIVYWWDKGERVPLRLADGDFGLSMYEALAGMSPPQKSILLDAVAAVARVQRTGVTTNPLFMLRNFVRDQMSAAILTDVGYKPFASGARGLADELSGAPLARRYAAQGGIAGGANVSSLDSARPNLNASTLKRSPTSAARFLSWKGIAHFSELSETGTRLGVFRNAVQQAKARGLSDHEAFREGAWQARDYFDLDLHGSRMLAARRVLPFLNANIQGLSKAARVLTANGRLFAATKSPLEQFEQVHAYKAWAKIAALGVLGLGIRALYQGDPEYAEFDDQERATNWIVKLGGTWFKIPKPFELAALSNVAERAFERFAMHDPTAWARLRSGLGQILIPPVENPLVNVPFELAANKDYAGRPIVPEALQGKVDPELQANAYNSALSQFLGHTLHMSPAQIDYGINGFAGSWGRDAGTVSNMLSPTRPQMAGRPGDMPFVGGFVAAPERGTASATQFWNLLAQDGGKMNLAEGTYRRLMDPANPAAAGKYLASLDQPTRDYVLSQVYSEHGSGKANPLARAHDAVTVLGALRREIAEGDVTGPNGRPISLNPRERAQVDTALSRLEMVEQHNGLRSAGVPGWAQQPALSRRDAVADLYDASPLVKDVLALRMRAAHVPNTGAAEKLWPLIQGRLNSLDDRTLVRLMARERLQSQATRLDEVLRLRAAAR